MTEPIESRLQALAKEFQYPPTPSVAPAVMRRLRGTVIPSRRNKQLVWALILLIVLLTGLMFVPTVRAAVLEFIQIGIVRIFPASTSTTMPNFQRPVTATPISTSSSLIPFLEQISGETTLENAQKEIGIPIPLPTYPDGLGQPDRVFLQNTGAWMLVLVWLDHKQPDHVQMSLHLIQAGSWTIDKYQPIIIKQTTVNNRRAIWAVGDYPLMIGNGNVQFTRLIDGHVLVWEENKITYRLETNLELDDAIRVAESLRAPVIP